MDRMKFNSKVSANMKRRRGSDDVVAFKGKFYLEHKRKGEVIGRYEIFNDVTNAGKNYILDVMFSDGTQIAANSWFIGLISSASYSALAAADTMASHAGWTEFTGYDEANRQAWDPAAPSGQAITGTAPATFTFNTTGTVKGAFLTSNNAKSGTTGTLWSTGLFSADVPVVDDDELNVTYNLSC